jgi:uncharacterized protein (TIGR03083 family)
LSLGRGRVTMGDQRECTPHERDRKPAVSEPNPEISCENCVAACCKAPLNMQLSEDEFKRHSPTMDLHVIVKPRHFRQRVQNADPRHGYMEIPSGIGVYELLSGCANLTENNRCSIYATRPRCCAAYEVGSPACRSARRDAGLDAHLPVTAEESLDAPDPTARLMAEFFPTAPAAKRSSGSLLQPVPPVEPLDLDALRAVIERDARWISTRLAASDAAVWSRRTRCAEWDVGGLATHLLNDQRLAQQVLTAALEGRVAVAAPDARAARAETVEAFGQVADRVCSALARIAPGDLAREVAIGGSESVSVQNLIEVLALELSVHALDLAHALGETRHLTSEEVKVVADLLPDQLRPNVSPPAGAAYVLRSVAFELPFSWRNNAWRTEPATDPCYIEGDAEAVLLYALGRVPFNKSGLVTNQPDRARAFKRHLAGP